MKARLLSLLNRTAALYLGVSAFWYAAHNRPLLALFQLAIAALLWLQSDWTRG